MALVAGACRYSVPEPALPVTHRTSLCETALQNAVDCLPPQVVLGWLQHPALSILGASGAPRGVQEARVLTLRVPSGGGFVVFRAKWRALSSQTRHNAPRKELAAFAVQTLFLDPAEYVVPPTSGYCFDLAEYTRHVDPGARPSFAGTNCVFGYLQYWLETARPLEAVETCDLSDGPLDAAHFERDANYRRSVAHLNLLTYLIDHDDTHDAQFMATGTGPSLRIYSVDNSMSFDSPTNPELRHDWSRIQVPALPANKIQRLARLGPNDLDRLATVEQYALDQGHLRSVAPRRGSENEGSMRWVGRELQVGLARVEIEQLRRRIAALLERVKRGGLAVFGQRET